MYICTTWPQWFKVSFCRHSWMKFFLTEINCILSTISQKCILKVPTDKISLVQAMIWHQPGDKPLTELMMTRILQTYGVTRPQWVNSLWPSDTIRHHISGSTLALVLACCLMAPSHYLKRCWLIISEILWHSTEGNITEIVNISMLDISLNY